MTQNLPQEIPAYLAEFYQQEQIDVGQFTSGINAGRGPHISVEGGTSFSLVSVDGLGRPPVDPNGQMLFDRQRGPFIDIIVLAASQGVLKRYYERGYVKGENLPPDCFSNDGRAPDPSVARPQNAICSGCKWDAFGTARGESEGKACSDRKRLAVLNLWDLNGPIYEYEVSPSNLKKWQAYAYNVAGRVPGGVVSVVTRIYFETGVQGGMLYEVAPQPNAQAGFPYPQGTGWWFCSPKIMPILAAARASPECRKAVAAPPTQVALPPPAAQGQRIEYAVGAGQPAQATGLVATPAAPLAHPQQIAHQPQQQQPQQQQPQQQQPQQQQPQAQPDVEQPKRTRRTRAQIEAEEAALRQAREGVAQAQQPVQQPAADLDPFGAGNVAGTAGGGQSQQQFQPQQTQQPVQQQPAADPMEIPGFLDRRGELQQGQTNVQFGVATGVPQTDPAMDSALAGMI